MSSGTGTLVAGRGMGFFWWRRGKRADDSSSGRSAGSVAARETLLRAEPAKYQVGGGEEAIGVALLLAGLYVFPSS